MTPRCLRTGVSERGPQNSAIVLQKPDIRQKD
jgi:hypothetical protein